MNTLPEPAFVRRAWYCAAWADEVTENLLPRRILDEPLVLFRDSAGKAHAIVDICPHKFAPLHLGQRSGDTVLCPYHGLAFDGTGRCVHNPHGDGKIPASARVKSYPLLEQWGVLWIWTDAATPPDETLLPDFSQLTDPRRRTVKGRGHVQGHYLYSVDNLMDLGHAMYLHRQTVGATKVSDDVEHQMKHDGQSVADFRLYKGLPAPAFYGRHMPDPQAPMDFWSDVRWFPASLIRNHVGASAPGKARGGDGVDQMGAHFLTPETAHTTHYFFANSRNYALDDVREDEVWRKWQETGLCEEDSSMVEAIERLESDAQRLGMSPVLLSVDAAGVRVRRIVQQLIAAEAA